MKCGEFDRAFLALSRIDATLGIFQAMINRISDHVGDRFGQPIYDGLVNFGSFALGNQANGLARHIGHFAD